MFAYCFIHSNGEIVEKFITEVESISELHELCDYARKKYGKISGFAFDVMMLADVDNN